MIAFRIVTILWKMAVSVDSSCVAEGRKCVERSDKMLLASTDRKKDGCGHVVQPSASFL